jgi:protein-S-isoprenylcysteine O-methyltransferase Ste14
VINFIGTEPINPIVFYSGKFIGYIVWGLFILDILNVKLIENCSPTLIKIVSLFLLLLSALIFIISLFRLGKSTRFGLPVEETRLKSKGIYSMSRNPMYVSFGILTLAAIIYFLNIWIIIPGMFTIIVYHLIILGEEKFLRERFGEEYLEYCQRVRRYF